MPSDEQDLWHTLKAVKAGNWGNFKTELLDCYPGSTGDQKYSMASLKVLIKKQASDSIQNAKEFGTYKRSFMKIATFLKGQDCLTDSEISNYFVEGLDDNFGNKLQDQLKAEHPTHHVDDPYTMDKLLKASLFILLCYHSRETKTGVQNNGILKKVEFDMDPNFLKEKFNISAIVSEVVKQLNLQLAAQGNQGTSMPIPPRNRFQGCNFCSDPGHFMKGQTGQR